MKDELLEFEPDASSRKTATDWLMKVISGKKPINFHLNGSERSEGEASDSAVAVEDMPVASTPDPPKRAGWAEVKREIPAAEFTAEDLCGAPAVPVIRVVPSPGDAITADDVCWVPMEKRLKPEPVAAPKQPELAAPKLKIVAQQEVPSAEARVPKTAEPPITADDISREPAPYMVEPMRNGFAVEPDAPDMEQEITAADIAREGVLREMSPAPRETRDAAVLPFSYKVIQSQGAASDTAEMPEKKESAPRALAEAVATAPIETVPVETMPVITAPEMVSAEATGIAEQAAPVEEPQLEVPDAQARVETATEAVAEVSEPGVSDSLNAIAVEAPEATVAEPVTDVPVVEPNAVVEMPVETAPEAVAVEPVEAAEPGVEMPAPDEALEESAAEAEIEIALHDAEVSGPAEVEPEAVAESAFAHEGFWGAAAGADGAAQGEAIYEKPVLQKVKRGHPSPEEMAEMGQRPEGWVTAWKTLLRLGSVLPWVARALPMIEAGELGEPQAGSVGLGGEPAVSGGLQEMRQDISGLRLVQYEIRTTVQDHSMQLKRMEEQLGRVRESMEAKGSQAGELAESLRSMTRLVRLASLGLGGLLLVLVVLMIVMLAHGR